MKLSSEHITMIVGVVRTAHLLQMPLHEYIASQRAWFQRELDNKRESLRRNAGELNRQLSSKMLVKTIAHYERELALLDELTARFASFRGEHPDARMPVFVRSRAATAYR